MNFEKQGKKSLFWGLDPRWAKKFGGLFFFDRPIKNFIDDLNDSRPIPHLKRDFHFILDGFQEPKKVQRKKVLVYVESLWRANSLARILYKPVGRYPYFLTSYVKSSRRESSFMLKPRQRSLLKKVATKPLKTYINDPNFGSNFGF